MRKVETANALSLAEYQSRFVGDLSDALQAIDKDRSLHLTFTSAAELIAQEKSVGQKESTIDACFQLIQATSRNDYHKSSVRWSPGEKRREMRLPDMRYLILKRNAVEDKDAVGTSSENQNSEGEVVEGFASFMITYEDGLEVVYIYEIHISNVLRGRGVGAKLMDTIENVARTAQMSKVMLTVFVSNESARHFYRKLGYTLDEYSPRPRKLRNGIVKEPDYHILSKSVEPEAGAKRIKT